MRSADYALSQFRYLHRLLLVHGRWGYKRVSYMICYYFYKNIILVFTEMYFPFYNGFSGQIYFADWLPMLYNAIWTSWHCLFAYVLEQVIFLTVNNIYLRMLTINMSIDIQLFTKQDKSKSTSHLVFSGNGSFWLFGMEWLLSMVSRL